MKLLYDIEYYLAKMPQSLQDKVLKSIELIKKAEPLAKIYDKEKGFYLGFSGGKDSQVIYHLAELSGVKFYPYFCPTSIDPAENISFIKKEYPEVEFMPLTTSIYKVAIKKNILPTRQKRWCCDEFKEKVGAGKVVILGVRKQESYKRKFRNEIEVAGKKFSGSIEDFNEYREERIKNKLKKKKTIDQFDEHKETMVTCLSGKDKILLSPILEWTEKDVWSFLVIINVPTNPLYKTSKRVGCIFCPMANLHHKKQNLLKYPYVKKKWVDAVKIMLNENKYRYNLRQQYSEISDDDFAECIVDAWIKEIPLKQFLSDKFLQFKLDL